MSKRFFYVCAGLLCLALAYHSGATNATAQAGQTLDGPNIETTSTGYTYFTAAIGRTFCSTSNAGYVPSSIAAPIPGSSPVVETQTGNQGSFVLLANGDIYDWTGQWTLRGNLCAALGPTPAKAGSFGQFKVKYR